MCQTALLDVRPEEQFQSGHVPGAVNIPFEELAQRTHELPPSREPLAVMDVDPTRAQRAAEWFRQRGHAVQIAASQTVQLSETGPSKCHLWRPNQFLVECLAVIEAHSNFTPVDRPRALDVACGSGRDAVYLALRGFDVHAIDVLPDALSRAQDLARRSGVHITTVDHDLEKEPALPPDHFELVTVFRFLHRELFTALRGAVARGGYIVYETFHQSDRREGQRPLHPDHLLKTGELAREFAGFEILIAADDVEREGRRFSHLLARRPM